jgi:transposase
VNKADLIAVNRRQEEQIKLLQKQNKLLEKSSNDFKVALERVQHQYDNLAKLVYGSKSERFISAVQPEQLSVFDTETEDIKEEEPEHVEVAKHKRYKNKPHPGRLEIPGHLPVEEVIIEPEENVEGLKKIGEEVTVTLEYRQASLVRKVTRRFKYEKAEGQGILIGELPARPINKGVAEASLLSQILVSKFVDHLPYHRQIAIFKRDFEWYLPQSTVIDWMSACCTLLWPLYTLLQQEILQKDYIQVDESPIKVQDRSKSRKTHQGYMWVYHDPLDRLVYFRYSKGRGKEDPAAVLADYTGYLQCDGYPVYNAIGAREGITLVGCLAHARRKFYEAKPSDATRSEYALLKFQDIYRLDKKIVEETQDIEERLGLRKKKVKPILIELKEWIEEESYKIAPQSPIAKAMTYYQNQWPKLEAIFLDGRLKLDNNLIENSIRPLALGRKNYMFAGSHTGAERNAMMYSFMGSCKMQGINPREWLENTLKRMPEQPMDRLRELLPGYNVADEAEV